MLNDGKMFGLQSYLMKYWSVQMIETMKWIRHPIYKNYNHTMNGVSQIEDKASFVLESGF
jgi:hypothetical protein